ncbi:SH3 domain-containing protein [Streptomyces sp. QTS137]
MSRHAQRSSRSPLLRRLPMTLAAGTLALAAAVAPAVANDTPDGGNQSDWSQQGGNGDGGDSSHQQGGNGGWDQQAGGNGDGGDGNDHGNNSGGGNAGGGDGGHQAGGNGNGGNAGDHGNNSGGGNAGGGDGGHQAGGNGNGGNAGDHGNNSGGGNAGGGDGGHQAGGNHGNRGEYKGVVTTDSLALRTSPDRGSKVIRYARKGDVVSIYCKVGGDDVQGNPLWYLLTDGTWAWGPARHIDNIGPAPRWC